MPWSKVPLAIRSLDEEQIHPDDRRRLDHPTALREAFSLALEADPNVFVMGQGVDDPGGMFGTTRGLQEEYGSERVFDTPLAESSLTGIAMGAALGGMRPVYMHNRPDFLYLAMDQLINHASKWHYMFGGAMSVPMVIWTCIGKGWGSGAQHSQALQGLFMQFPGLKFVMPSTAYDAKGLMLSAIADPNPVLIMEHRHTFNNKAHVPEELYYVPFGKGVVRREGTDVTIVSISQLAIESQRAAETLAEDGLNAEVIDLRSLRPLDESIVLKSIEKTGRLVVVDHGWPVGGVAAEISALVAEKGFYSLKAPIKRVTCMDVPTPSGYTLEDAYYPNQGDIIAAVNEVVADATR